MTSGPNSIERGTRPCLSQSGPSFLFRFAGPSKPPRHSRAEVFLPGRVSRILLRRCVLLSRAMSDLCLLRVLKNMPHVCLHAPCMFVLRCSITFAARVASSCRGASSSRGRCLTSVLRRVLKSMPRVCLHAPCMFVLRFSSSTYDMYTLINTP